MIMAEMGLGYGSEYQLMRFLGHHREELDKLVQNATGQFEPIKWMDYPYDKNRKSGDGELTGIECFKDLQSYPEIESAWKEFWPQGGSPMNWDGILTINGTWFFVEAKANEREAYQTCRAKGQDSKAQIDRAMDFAKQWLEVDNDIVWRRTNCYQLANRLAFTAFCNKICNIPVRLLYVGFINGFKDHSITNISDWEAIWKNEYESLGLNADDLKGVVYHIYPDCNQ